MEITLRLYNYIDGINDTPFPNKEEQAMFTFTYDANRMGGSPTINATVKHRLCLDDLWTDNVYAEFRGEKYFVMNTPSSSKDNEDERYEHDVELLSEREVLNHIYFIDTVQGDSEVDVYKSNSTKVQFMGDIKEFVSRLNSCFSYHHLDYTAVIDDGITSEDKLVSFEDKYILEALQEIFNIYEIPYYFVGKVVHIGYTENAITLPLKYGFDGALLSISKENANYQVINKIKGTGSSDNIPYYYPNESDDREAIEVSGKKWITPMPNLMPSIYRETEGAEMFYEAKNNTYPDGEGGYYEFENEYSDRNQKQGTTTFEEIKPTIKEMTNASGQRIDMFTEFAYDLNDNDETDEDGNYLHPYFFAKLRKFDGQFGFNLFDHAIESQTMQFSFTSGVCGACSFELGVGEETNKNIVQVDDDGNLKRDEDGNVLWQNQTPQDRQNDTQNYEVWIALKKDDSTYGQIMPNKSQNLRPSTDDTFVILGIDLPLSYVKAAEKKLEDSLIKYMWMNNKEKFTFSIKFSRIFFTEHPEVLEKLNENARLLIEYNGQQHTLYVDSFTYKTDESSPLPEIEVNLVDTLTIGQNSLQNALDSVKQDILSSIGGGDFLKQGLKYFLRKDVADYANGLITFNKGANYFKFLSGMIGSGASIYDRNKTGKIYLEADGAILRDELVVPKITFNCIDVISGDKANTFAYGTILDVDTQNKTATLDLLEDQFGTLHVDDICRGVFHNVQGGNETDLIEDTNGFYKYSGFSTSYFTPKEILVNKAGEFKFRYELQEGTTVHPMKGMNFFAYGNFTDETRQAITYETRYYTRRLKDVNTWVIDPTKNVSMQDGLLEGLNIGGFEMHGYGTFQENSYFTGVNIQFTPEQEEQLKGEGAIVIDLSNEIISLNCNSEGGVTFGLPIKTSVSVYQGTKKLDISNITLDKPSTVTATATTDGIITITDVSAEAPDNINIGVNVDFLLKGETETRSTNLNIIKVRDGKDGIGSVVYELLPSYNTIAVDADGNKTPTYISCSLIKRDGETVESVSEIPSGYTMNKNIDNSGETLYTIGGSFSTSSIDKTLQFLLYKGSQLVDKETIPVLYDGKNGQDGTDGTDGQDGTSTEIIYKWSNFKPDTPIRTDFSPEGWRSSPDYPNFEINRQGNFSLVDGWYQSPNNPLDGNTYYDYIYFTTTVDDISIVVDLDISSESKYDKGYLSLLDGDRSTVSGQYTTVISGEQSESVEILVPNKGSHFLYVYYVKDSSGSNGHDMLRYKVSFPQRCWMSTAVKYPGAPYIDWSEPIEFIPDSDTQESIYIRTSKAYNVNMPSSSPNIKEYIGEAPLYSSGNYTEGFIVKYNGKYKIANKYTNQTPTDTSEDWDDAEWWSDDPKGVTESLPYEYTCSRKFDKNTTEWGEYGSYKIFQYLPKDGESGEAQVGLQGMITRRSIFKVGVEYHNDFDIEDKSVLRYIDVVLKENRQMDTGYEAYQCVKTHVSQSMDDLSDTSKWKQINNMASLYTDLIIAKNALIDFYDGNEIRIHDDTDTIDAGITGSNEGDKIRFWAGSVNPSDAPFKVLHDGSIISTKGTIGGWSITSNSLQSTDFVRPTFSENTVADNGEGSFFTKGGLMINGGDDGILVSSSGMTLTALISAISTRAYNTALSLIAKCSNSSGVFSEVCALEIEATNAYSNPNKLPLAIRVKKGAMDIPGVLLAGRVPKATSTITAISAEYKYGLNRTSYGAFQAGWDNSLYEWKITHNLGHTRYAVIVTPYRPSEDIQKIHPIILEVSSNYFKVIFIDSNSNKDREQSGFCFTVIGDNY